jgi:hypothetical protein
MLKLRRPAPCISQPSTTVCSTVRMACMEAYADDSLRTRGRIAVAYECSSLSTVGMSSATVGWMCTARASVV